MGMGVQEMDVKGSWHLDLAFYGISLRANDLLNSIKDKRISLSIRM